MTARATPERDPRRWAALALGAATTVLVGTWLAAQPAGTPAASARSAEPFVPGDASAVLERLPGGAREARALEAARRIRANSAAVATEVGVEGGAGPGAGTGADRTATASLAVARRHLDLARESGDQREAGRAQAVLGRWADAVSPPVEVRVLRAAVAQHLHAFDEALADLDAAIATSPDDPQPRWLRSAVLRTLGRLDEAAADCERVDRLAQGSSPSAIACIEDIKAWRGDRGAAVRLDSRLEGRPVPPGERGWIELVRAEIAEREGRDADAERRFRVAIAYGAGRYALVAFADWLLERGRPGEAVTLLRDAPSTDAVLTLRAIAARRLGDRRAADDVAELRARFEASRDRGEADHHSREQARFTLDIDGDAQAAVALALRNWATQKEPADAVLLARAARAAGRPQAAEPMWRFIAAHRIDDVRLERP